MIRGFPEQHSFSRIASWRWSHLSVNKVLKKIGPVQFWQTCGKYCSERRYWKMKFKRIKEETANEISINTLRRTNLKSFFNYFLWTLRQLSTDVIWQSQKVILTFANQTSKFIHNAFTKISFKQWSMLYTNLKEKHCRTVYEYNGKYPIISVMHSINLHFHNT